MINEILKSPDLYLYSVQHEIFNGRALAGEKITSANGQTGYIDWPMAGDNNLGYKTARMRLAYQVFDIHTIPIKNGHGSKLFIHLLNRIKQSNYNRLVILGAVPASKDFYDKIIARQINTGLVKNVLSSSRRFGESNYPQYDYIIYL